MNIIQNQNNLHNFGSLAEGTVFMLEEGSNVFMKTSCVSEEYGDVYDAVYLNDGELTTFDYHQSVIVCENAAVILNYTGKES